MIDRAEKNVRQQHGLQGAVVRWLEVDLDKKWPGYPARFIGFLQNLFVHLVPGVVKKDFARKNKYMSWYLWMEIYGATSPN